jgi:outer membrane protein OmpA-like peptidoglycan-associated protein
VRIISLWHETCMRLEFSFCSALLVENSLQRIVVLLGGLLALAVLSWFCVKQHAEPIAAKRAALVVSPAAPIIDGKTVALPTDATKPVSGSQELVQDLSKTSTPVEVSGSSSGNAATPAGGGAKTEALGSQAATQAIPAAKKTTIKGVQRSRVSGGKHARKSSKSVRIQRPKASSSKVCPSGVRSASILGQVCYGSGQAILTEESKRLLAAVAVRVKESGQRVQISGFADSSGTVAGNAALSAQRARLVAKVFEDNGVAANMIEVRGMGVEGSNPGLIHRRVDVAVNAP